MKAIMCLMIFCFALPGLSGAQGFRFPLDGAWGVIQDFGVWNSRSDGYHLAEDVGASIGASVFAASDGLVKYAAIAGGYSGLVIVEHRGICTLYGHLSEALGLKVSAGQLVSKGDLLGYIANPSEYSKDPDMPPHVHFGIRKGTYTDERFCGHWAYVGYTQECEGMTHNQYMTMWTDPSVYIESLMQPSTTFYPGSHAIILPEIGLSLRDSHRITADNSNKIAVMPKGADVAILDHPDSGIPVDGYYWWYVQYNDMKGWCAETDYQGTEVFLEMAAPPKAEIKVEDATFVWEAELTRSVEITAAASVVSPRITVEYADTLFSERLLANNQLREAAKSVLPRITMEYTDSVSVYSLQEPEGIQDVASAVSPRMIVEYADTLFSTDLYTFPMSSPPSARRELIITSTEIPPGGSASIMINVTDAIGITGADISVKYDPSVITIGEVKSTDLTSNMSLVVNKEIPGQIKVSMAGIGGIPFGSGALLEIGLTVNTEAQPSTLTQIQFAEAILYDESARAIPTTLVNSTIKIAEPAGAKGDANGDGRVDSRDAILALQFAVGMATPTDEELYAADMNGNGRVGADDVILILLKAAGLAAPGVDILATTASEITIALAETYGVAGESISVTLHVDNAVALAAGDIWVAYDSAVLRAVDTSTDSSVLLASNVNMPGLVRIAFANANGLNSKTLATILFDVLSDDVSPLEFKTVELYDHSASPIDSRKIDGKFTSWKIPPEHGALLQNYPNPFNPDTWIPYHLKEAGEVTIQVFSTSGELVRDFKLGYKSAGVYVSQDRAAYWDGKNEASEQVSSGVYFYTIQAGDFTATRKMVVAK